MKAKIGTNYTFFIDYLREQVSSFPEYVSEIILEMTQNKVFFGYSKETIKQIISELYNNQQIAIADRLCNLYSENGRYFLRDVYNEYHSKN